MGKNEEHEISLLQLQGLQENRPDYSNNNQVKNILTLTVMIREKPSWLNCNDPDNVILTTTVMIREKPPWL
jgi:hypothetical protein